MFTHTCTACNKRQLIHSSQITAVDGAPGNVITAFTCWCGAQQNAQVDFITATTRVPAGV